MTARMALVALLAAPLGWASKADAQSAAPTSARIVFGFAAGSAGDLLARLLAEHMQAASGQSVLVENRTGASGRIAINAVKNGPADGSMILISPNGPLAITPLYDPRAGYDARADFAPVSELVSFDVSLAVAANAPAKTISELVPWLKANPDKAAYGTPGPGTNLHFMAMTFAKAAGLDMRAVHYRGATPGINDVLAGQLPMVASPLSDQIAHHRDGKLRILASAGAARSPFAPNVPTFQEAGYAVRADGWYAAFVPASTPAAVVARLNRQMSDALAAPDVKARLLAAGLEPKGSSADAMARTLEAEIAHWKPIVEASGFRPAN